jgi:hypothetical protein
MFTFCAILTDEIKQRGALFVIIIYTCTCTVCSKFQDYTSHKEKPSDSNENFCGGNIKQYTKLKITSIYAGDGEELQRLFCPHHESVTPRINEDATFLGDTRAAARFINVKEHRVKGGE